VEAAVMEAAAGAAIATAAETAGVAGKPPLID